MECAHSLSTRLRGRDWEARIDVKSKRSIRHRRSAARYSGGRVSDHFVNVILQTIQIMNDHGGVYAAQDTRCAHHETCGREGPGKLRVTGMSPEFVQTNLAIS